MASVPHAELVKRFGKEEADRMRTEGPKPTAGKQLEALLPEGPTASEAGARAAARIYGGKTAGEKHADTLAAANYNPAVGGGADLAAAARRRAAERK